mmetsp:Transcript_35935/g.66462  ORF Transcript_35935/g.66462 Transcript_35935/m.66462 type:complete len:334 (-) Transcript_35935:91-1092(-)
MKVDDQKARAANIAMAQHALAAAQLLQQQGTLTRKARRIHFSGLPVGITPHILREYINKAMVSAKLCLPNAPNDMPVNECTIGPDGRYAFVEFRSVYEAGNVIMLNGINVMGSTLRIQRPKDYVPAPTEMLMQVVPPGIQNASAAALVTGGVSRPLAPTVLATMPAATTTQSELNNLQMVTRRARRLHVGNLPIGAGLTAEMLQQYINAMMVSKGLSDTRIKGDPVMNCNIPNEKFGFIEIRTVHEATKALELNGIELGENKLRVQRPHDYQPVPLDMLKRHAALMGYPPPPEDSGVAQPTLDAAINSIPGVSNTGSTGPTKADIESGVPDDL